MLVLVVLRVPTEVSAAKFELMLVLRGWTKVADSFCFRMSPGKDQAAGH